MKEPSLTGYIKRRLKISRKSGRVVIEAKSSFPRGAASPEPWLFYAISDLAQSLWRKDR